MDFTPASLAQRLVDLDLVEPHKIDTIWTEVGRGNNSVDDLVGALLRKELVTNFQLDRVFKGERIGYYYGPYKVLYLIGAGTFARVYRAVHRDTGRVVAVKVLRKRHRDEQVQVEQFLREGRMGLKLRHPNIVSIYEIEYDVRAPFIVMEFVEGQTLRELIEIRKKFDPLGALRIIADVCTGLDFAGRLGISHRDMKLSNILVGSTGRCRLVDFGLAALADTSTPEALADCPSARAIDYAALERGTGVRKDDTRSDIYFTGTILYHILTGQSPLTETRDRLARLNVSRFREVKSITTLEPSMPLSVVSIVNKAMEVDPTKRYQSASDMLADVQTTMRRLEAGDTTTARELVHGQNSRAFIDPEAAKEGRGRTVMVVESKLDLQDLLREKLKSRGYRVLVFGDPERALNRFNLESDGQVADCVVFGATEMGNTALDAYNKLGTDPHTKDVPAVLLVDRKQQHIIRSALSGPKRMMLAMPLKVRELRTALIKLIGGPSGTKIDTESTSVSPTTTSPHPNVNASESSHS